MEENGDNDVFTFIPIFAQNFFNLFSKLIFYAIPLLRKYLTLFMCVDLKALQYLYLSRSYLAVLPEIAKILPVPEVGTYQSIFSNFEKYFLYCQILVLHSV